MAVRVGIDLVAVDTVRQAMHEHGDRYLQRIYTAAELRDCRDADGIIPQRLAARFAAKEATIKVLRPAGDAIPWQDIGVARHPAGWVELELSGRAAAAAAERGLADFAVSLSHEEHYATAVVIATCGEQHV